jgi:cytochrome c oxidase cbb3-type subunit 2
MHRSLSQLTPKKENNMADNNHKVKLFSHEKIETSNTLMIVLTLVVVLFGALVEIVPLFFQHSTTEPVPGLKPYTALQLAGRDVYLREGSDLQRVGGKYSDEWHRAHLHNPRDVVPESNMPAYPWLEENKVDPAGMAPRMKALRMVGVPYSDAEISASAEDVKDKTELEAVIAYLQVLGTSVK